MTKNAYAQSGVDVEAGYEVVARIKKHVARTERAGVMGALGGFGGMFDLTKTGVKEPVLISGTDGVGTKLMLAIKYDKHDTIGQDCVAMCVNDIIAAGAEPLYFLDYIATGKNEPAKLEQVVAGVAEGCVQSGAALIGGETAEMPGMYGEDDYDLAGFAVGVAIVYAGVRMILADLIPAFQGIATKLIPNAVPAVDCAVFFPYAPTAVIIGFAFSFLGGLIGMFILGAIGGVLIIPGMVPHFFCGATAGIYGNATGGRKGAILGSFVNGLFLAFLPAAVLPVLGELGFANTTFGDFDFGVFGILLGRIGDSVGQVGIYVIVAVLAVILLLPNFLSKSDTALNNVCDEEE